MQRYPKQHQGKNAKKANQVDKVSHITHTIVLYLEA